MRKFLTSILALVLACALPLSALAAKVTATTELPADLQISSFHDSGNLLVYGRGDDNYLNYWLVSPDGKELTPHYYDIRPENAPDLSVFIAATGDNAAGLLNDRTGEIIVPAEYGAIDVCSAQWSTCAHLTPSSDPDAPYRNFISNERYDLVDTDVYYGAQKAATLTEKTVGYAYAYGDYLKFRTETHDIWVSASGEVVTYERDAGYSSEYTQDYSAGKIIHSGSGQEAFVPGCTLTPAQVDKAYWMKDEGIVDLQGNVLLARDAFPYKDLYLFDSYGDYMVLSHHDDELSESLYGVMDKTGKIIVPCELLDVPYLSAESPMFKHGCLPALTTDNHLNIYDPSGAVLLSIDLTPYGEDPDHETNGAYTLIEYGDDQYALFSTARGVIDVSAYEEIELLDNGYVMLSQDDKEGVMDQNGDMLLPCIHNLLDISADGKLAYGYYYNEDYQALRYLYSIEP